MIVGVNLNHDYALAIYAPPDLTLLEQERTSRIKHHWTPECLTLALLDEWDESALRSIEAIALCSPKSWYIEEQGSDLSSTRRRWTYEGGYLSLDRPSETLTSGVLKTDGAEVPAYWVSHYHAHAASAVWAWGRSHADVLCLDGGGDFGFGAVFDFDPPELSVRERLLHWAYARGYHDIAEDYFGSQGFHEGRLMAAAAYGDASHRSEPMFDSFGRMADRPISRHDLARTHVDFVDAALQLVRSLDPRHDALVCAGGCFLNVTLNQMLAESGLYADVYVPPFTTDMGTAIGAALLVAQARDVALPSTEQGVTFLGRAIEADPTELDAVAREVGAVIQWSLPAALPRPA
ncbi:MAG TPA: carbamoyltransferase N-terminal domain-containing protein [Gaiellaceae bacterium]|jgi:predicted NodU family carbamoyl transferase|nr:carbamoyltransferase N-terminal domain-containing protein [Gaiellaceae bacterium]